MIRQLVFTATSVLSAAQLQTPQMTVPALGYVFDGNAKAIRLISGVPGAANLDTAVSTGATLESAFVHSRARIAIANKKDGGLALVQWNGSARVSALASAIGRAATVAFTRQGDRAAITDGTTVEAWSGLNGDPVLTASFSPGSAVNALAINQQGLVAAATGSGIVLLGDDGRALAPGADWTALEFLASGSDIVAASPQSLVLIHDIQNDAPAISPVLTLDRQPSALAVASDGTRAVLAVDDHLVLVNLASGDARSVSCKCHVGRFDALEGNLVFNMTEAGTGRLLMLDADAGDARVASFPQLNGGIRQ